MYVLQGLKASSAATGILAGALIALSCLPAPAQADPPAHAPAHGWRKKHDSHYLGYTGRQWSRDYGILDGWCDREMAGAVLGGALGGAVGSQIGDGSGRAVAVLVGTAIGAVLGAELARSLGDPDRACIGHALELLPAGHQARWDAPGGLHYRLIAGKDAGRSQCREFTLIAEGAQSRRAEGLGCRRADGSWEIVGL